LSLGTPPFGPALTSAPNDFTIALNYTGGGVSSPTAIAIDEFGDAWITDNGSTASVTELSPVGVALNSSPFTVGGLQSPTGIAIDLNGNALITNDFYPGSVTALTSTGTVLGSAFTGNGLNEPDAVAVDSSNHIWVANAGQLQNGQMSEFNESGNTIGSSPFGPTFGNIEAAVAVDLSGNLWTINAYIESPQLYAFSGGALVSANTYAPINNPTGLAIDASNRVWYSTHGSNVVVMNNDGTSKSTAYSGGGLQYSQAIAMDGASNAWIANTTFTAPDPGLLSEFSNSGTAITSSTGYKSSTMLAPSGIAVDGSGDVWVINKGNSTVSEFIGAAVPVITPFAYALQVGQLGSEP
jgi:sugar lactone lactonase YvrE